MEDHRAQRVSEAVKEELAEIIGFELDDPRLEDVNVTNAEVSSDMRTAHIKVSIGDEVNEKKTMAALEHAKGYLKHELASRLNLRRVPDLYFSADSHPDAESRIDFLLRRAKRTKARD
jgi:ribosome-binding factor A